MTRPISADISKRGPRSVKHREEDALTLRAIAQAAVDVELFTIPLYMSTLYSIQGMHQITGKDEDFYAGRWWPGLVPTAPPAGNNPADSGLSDYAWAAQKLTGNQWAFNLIFSVFIEEMLHLQIAANIASVIGMTPKFTNLSPPPSYGWACYGPDKTVIPHIVDLRDTKEYAEVKVNIAALTTEQVNLFLAIEAPEKEAHANIKDDCRGKYALNHTSSNLTPVPFDKNWNKNWKPDKTVEKTVTKLPRFGTIGSMYQCYLDYMSLPYDDGTTLWQYVFTPQQNDMFNLTPALRKDHPEGEYPGFKRTLTETSFDLVKNMMDAITDQGEGSTLKLRKPEEFGFYGAVMESYQADRKALETYYPSYDETGKKMKLSAHAAARCDNDGTDHYERFEELLKRLKDKNTAADKKITTWVDWHRDRDHDHDRWKAEDLQPKSTKDLQPETDKKGAEDHKVCLPSAEDIAKAMNRIRDNKNMRALISQAAVGSIAGITTVLDEYWAKPDVTFPYPSMVGSGDRMSICWALFGEAPDLSRGIGSADANTLQHACQSLDFHNHETDKKGYQCAEVAVFHSCRGSNKCMAQGGCGFVQQSNVHPPGQTSDQPPPLYSAPGDNKCNAYGGCAVPISASQVLSKEGVMELFDFDVNDRPTAKPLLDTEGKPVTITFEKGEKVYDVAYRAYREVMKKRHESNPEVKVPAERPSDPSDLRLVFPPST